ncbi:MAG: hypothetical protein HY978_04205 [Candidatus Liptonbacteria bacterium]|nr:hypothetical protein [Candidatus Liptonbacteria bacterium]
MLTQCPAPLDSPPRIHLKYIAAILASLRRNPAAPIQAALTGWVTRLAPLGKVVFMTLRDATGSVQLKCGFDTMSAEQWQSAKALKLADRITVTGAAGFNTFHATQTPTVFADTLSILLPGQFGDTELLGSEREAVTKQFFLSRLRTKAQLFFASRGFEEFDAYYLSSRQVSYAITSLRVVFPGFGAPTFMAPSPASQLLTALFAAPSSKVFCVSRCFSNEIRDGYTSAESPLVCLMQLAASTETLCQLGEDCIKAVFSDIVTMPDLAETHQAWLGSDSWLRQQFSLETESEEVSEPTIQIFPPPNTAVSHGLQSVFRISWPERFVLVEGHTQLIDTKLSLGGFTLHLERMIPALRTVILRRLRPL